jgi:hypothetical protein
MGKFSRGLNSNFVSPMFPLLETLQASILSHLDKLVVSNSSPSSPLSASFVFSHSHPSSSSASSQPTIPLDLEELSRQMDEKYTDMVRNYENQNKAANPSSEITRMVFTIFGAVEFSQWLHQLEDTITRLPPEEKSIRLTVIKGI